MLNSVTPTAIAVIHLLGVVFIMINHQSVKEFDNAIGLQDFLMEIKDRVVNIFPIYKPDKLIISYVVVFWES